MLCDQCQQALATVFATQIIHGEMSKKRLCESCAAPLIRAVQAQGINSDNRDFPGIPPGEEAARYAASVDSHFPAEAYMFILRAVRAAVDPPPASGVHVSAREVAEAFRRLALAEFGANALAALAEWRISSCDDIGTMVFRMVELGILGARPEDKPEDFHGIYDFQTAFPANP
jgi:uncharacterized repeat protein (TIGR04138 family)